MVAILYTQGVRLKTLGLLARCMFLDGPGAKNDFYIFKKMVKKRKKSGHCPGGPVVKNPPCGNSLVVQSGQLLEISHQESLKNILGLQRCPWVFVCLFFSLSCFSSFYHEKMLRLGFESKKRKLQQNYPSFSS